LGGRGSKFACGRILIERVGSFLILDFWFGFCSKNFVILLTLRTTLAGLGYTLLRVCRYSTLRSELRLGKGKTGFRVDLVGQRLVLLD
jgi:hypothetical protein